MPGSRVVLALLALFSALVVGIVLAFLLAPGAFPPGSVTESGDAINQVYWVVLGLAAGVFFLVETALIVFIVRYRRRGPGTGHDVEGPQIHGNTRVEIVWTVVPAVLLVALASYTFARIPDVEAKPGAGEEPLVVDVTAHQFYWQYEYPNGALSFDALYLPVDRKVTLRLRSADVPHSWWVPELTGKRDAIPGQTNELHFTPRETGTFENGVCGEFCGIQHARMTTTVQVLAASGFEAWLARNAPDTVDPTALGEAEWRASCAKCHGLEGEGGIGPPIAGNPALTNVDSLRTLLYEGQNLDTNEGFMPPTGKRWTDAQIEALVDYVGVNDTLSGGGGGGR
ncbi:MAG TPA: cytochrome c oxidase subunit II [Gaiellaceae bacterium]|nr:cytochrome c oxidase subunit II [Gaiellaceae bacterium]